MLKKLRSIGSLLSRLLASYPSNPKAILLYRYFRQEAAIPKRQNGCPIAAVQCVEDPLYYGLLGSIARDLQRRTNATGRLVFTRSVEGGIGDGYGVALERSDLVGWITSSKWARINRDVVGTVGYRCQSFNHPFGDLCDLWRAYRLWRSLRGSADISKLTVRGVLVGDLIIDTYLRFRPSPQFQIKDRFVWRLLWQAHRDIRRAHLFFSNHRPRVYLSSYSTYIQHGIAVRVALAQEVAVYSFGSLLVFGKRLGIDDAFHTPDTSRYRSLFENLDNQRELLCGAEEQLNTRLSGRVDDATSYMKASAYAVSDEPLPDVNGAVVIFLHDFYDSPHVYDDLVFPDFWAWITCTIDTLTSAGMRFFVKPHPNQITLSDQAVRLLVQQYPGLQMISPRITNVQLVRGGMICGVTAYGTVAHELAHMGVPTIACARHPHHAFDFCRTAKSVEEYRRFLQTPHQKPLPADEMKRQALAFFYMHNIYGDENTSALRRQFVALFKAAGADDRGDSLLQELARLRSLPAYDLFINELAREYEVVS